MQQPAEREFSLPIRQRVPAWVWLLALLLHGALVVVFLVRRHAEPAATVDLHSLSLGDSVRQVTLPAYRQSHLATQPVLMHVPTTVPMSVPTSIPVAPPAAATVSALPGAPLDTSAPGVPGDLRPHFGAGHLWVQPMTESPRGIARALSGKTDQQLTDSAVAAMIQTYFDAMAAEVALHPQTLPSWTTKIGGKTVGLDSKWIYLGPIKIPTALLALLPINLQGNMSNYQYNQQLQSMRADLFDAARRAANYDDFKKAVKDLKDQTAERREFNKNQRTRPDTSHHG